MYRSAFLYLFVFALLLLYSCIESFDPDLNTTQSRLVVQAFISTERIPHVVTISKTQSLDAGVGQARVSGASVCIEDDKGNCYEVSEITNGRYVTDTTLFIPKTGNSYRLRIETPDDQSYLSEFTLLKEPHQIDTLWLAKETENRLINSAIVEDRVTKIYTSVKKDNDAQYGWFDYGGIYTIQTPRQGDLICFYEQPMEPIPEPPLTCFIKETTSNPLNLFSTEGVSSDNIYEAPILSFNPSFKFLIAYNMTVKRFTIDKSNYDFLSQIKLQGEYGGSLFDAPPTEILGNIENVSQPENKPLGSFIVASYSTAQIIIRATDFSDQLTLNEAYPDCYPQTIPNLPPEEQPKPAFFCCDCRIAENSTTITPQNWSY